jgi:hypothetical protein
VNGTHQIRSFVTIVQPHDHGSWSVVTAMAKPIGPNTLPSMPTSTIGQWRHGSLAAIR